MVRNKNEVFGYIKSLLLRAVGKVSKPHVLVSRVPDSTGSDPERKITGTKLTSTWQALLECSQGPVLPGEAQCSPNLLDFTRAETLMRLPQYLGIYWGVLVAQSGTVFTGGMEVNRVEPASLVTGRFLYAKVISRWSFNALKLSLEKGKNDLMEKEIWSLVNSSSLHRMHTKRQKRVPHCKKRIPSKYLPEAQVQRAACTW